MIDDGILRTVGKGVHSSGQQVLSPQRWQLSLRSLLILISMAAVTFGWSRLVGHSFWHWPSWLTIGTIALPYLWVVLGAAISARWHVAHWLKLWVLVLGVNTTWGFYLCLSVISVEDLRVLPGLVREAFINEFWTAFALPLTLGILATLSVARPHRQMRLGDWAFVSLVTCNVAAVYWTIPFVFSKAWAP